MTDPAPLPEQPFRYGIFDLLVVIVLGALEGYAITEIMRAAGGPRGPAGIIAGLIFGYCFAIGGGFLASRFWTERRIESPWRRVYLIIAVNLLLTAICVGLYLSIVLTTMMLR